MLRGHDPFQEVYRWMRVLNFLMALAIIILLLADQVTDYKDVLTDLTMVLAFSNMGLCVIIFILWIVLLMYLRKSFNQLRQQRMHVLAGEILPIAAQQPDVAAASMELPQLVRRRLLRGVLITITILLIIFSAGLILQQLPLFVSNPYTLPDLVFEDGVALNFFLTISALLSLAFSISIISGYYMLPSLDIDDHGITAHYGHHTVMLAWADIRYFAMSNNKQIARAKASVKPFVYEICDGDNIINWASNTPITMAYSIDHPDYARLATEQLPALVVARTGLPLLDLRQIK